jgi:hypothetical protein
MLEPKQNHTSPRTALFVIACVAIPQYFAFLSVYVYSAYFERGTFANTFLFRPSDESVAILKPIKLGVHFFGDFYQIFYNTKIKGSGGYFGFSQLLMFLVSDLHYFVALALTLLLGLIFFYMGNHVLLFKFSKIDRQLVFSILCVSFYPILLCLDRGQIHLLSISLVFLGLALIKKSNSYRAMGTFLLCVGISFKIAPIFFILLFIRNRDWRSLRNAGAALIFALTSPAIFMSNGIMSIPKSFLEIGSSLYSSPEYFGNSLAHNQSFKALAYWLAQSANGSVQHFGELMFHNYSIIAVLLAVILMILIISPFTSNLEALILCSIGAAFLVPISGLYTNVVFLVCLIEYIQNLDESKKKIESIYVIALGVICAGKNIPLNLGFFQSSVATMNTVINPVLVLFLIVMIGSNSCKSQIRSVIDTKTEVFSSLN